MSWGIQPPPQGGGQEQPVSVLLAHRSVDQATSWNIAMQSDARFRVSNIATDPHDFRAKLSSSPEVILLDLLLFGELSSLTEALTSVAGSVYIVVPSGVVSDANKEAIKQIRSVKHMFEVDVNLMEFQNRAYQDAIALRRSSPSITPNTTWGTGRSGVGGPSGGLRIITTWSRAGGVGKTTIAAALAQAVARKGTGSLLVGLGSPCVLPLLLELKREPSIMNWIANPSEEGLRISTQALGDLHVITGFPDIASEVYGDRPAEQKGSLMELVTTAAYGRYSSIILDAPTAGVAPRAISAANTWLMVARPTYADAWASVEAFRMVTQQMSGKHRIVPGNIFVVLNQCSPSMMTHDEWHKAADSACRNLGLPIGFPPVVATIPYSPEVGNAQDRGRSALDASDEFARPIHRLADMLFGGGNGAAPAQGQRDTAKVINLGPFKMRVKS